MAELILNVSVITVNYIVKISVWTKKKTKNFVYVFGRVKIKEYKICK